MAVTRILFVPIFLAMQRLSSETWATNGLLQLGAMATWQKKTSPYHGLLRIACYRTSIIIYVCLAYQEGSGSKVSKALTDLRIWRGWLISCSSWEFVTFFHQSWLSTWHGVQALMAFSNGYVHISEQKRGRDPHFGIFFHLAHRECKWNAKGGKEGKTRQAEEWGTKRGVSKRGRIWSVQWIKDSGTLEAVENLHRLKMRCRPCPWC